MLGQHLKIKVLHDSVVDGAHPPGVAHFLRRSFARRAVMVSNDDVVVNVSGVGMCYDNDIAVRRETRRHFQPGRVGPLNVQRVGRVELLGAEGLDDVEGLVLSLSRLGYAVTNLHRPCHRIITTWADHRNCRRADRACLTSLHGAVHGVDHRCHSRLRALHFTD